MEKMRLGKMLPGRLVHFFVVIVIFCLPTNAFAHSMPGITKTFALAFNNNFELTLVIAALIVFNYIVFFAHKQIKREQRY